MGARRRSRRGLTLHTLATAAALALAPAVFAPTPAAHAADGLVMTLPENPREVCAGSRARIYSECRAQREILDEALALAAAQGKSVLVSAGAEWCVWCHVLGATLQGFVDSASALEDETLEARADALREAVAERFVLAHLEIDKSPDGEALLAEIGAWPHFADWIPFVFGVDAEGQFVDVLGERGAEQGGEEADEAEEAEEAEEAADDSRAAAGEADDNETESAGENNGADSGPLGYDRALLLARIIALSEKIEQANQQ